VGDFVGRLKQGAWYGFIFACFYGLYAVGLYILRGPEPFKHDGTTLSAALAAYFVGGIVAGGIIGALQPFSRSRIGAMFVYSMAVFFVFVSIAIAADGIHHIDWLGCIIGGIVFGIIGSFVWRNLLA